MISVLRLERASNHRKGPWNYETDLFAAAFGLSSEPNPAKRADEEAKKEGVRLPSSMPSPDQDNMRDPDDSDKYLFGFASMAQYHEWFRTEKVRAVMFDEPSDLQLVEYHLPDKTSILRGGHQIAFKPPRNADKLVCTIKFATE